MDERRLRKFFRFTEADLLANRRGKFSENQKKCLEETAGKERKSARESAVILFMIAAAGLAVGVMVGSIASTPIGRLSLFLLMGILWPSAWAGKGIQIIRAANDLQEPHLCKMSGPIHIHHHGEREYTLQMGELAFDLDENPSGVIMEGDEYTLYYVEASQEILSVDGSRR